MIEILCSGYPGLIDEEFCKFMTMQLNDGQTHRMVRWLDTGNSNHLVYYLLNEDIAANIEAIKRWCGNNMRHIERVQIGYGHSGRLTT